MVVQRRACEVTLSQEQVATIPGLIAVTLAS